MEARDKRGRDGEGAARYVVTPREDISTEAALAELLALNLARASA